MGMGFGQQAMNENPWSVLKFTIVLPPRGQSRPHGTVLTDKDGNPVRSRKNGRFVILHHKGQKQKSDEKKLHALLLQHAPPRPLQGPIRLGVRAFFPIPRSKPKKWVQAAEAGESFPTKKPDMSNIVKNLEDVGNGIFWEDDAQIIGFTSDTGKYWGDPGRYEITILFRRDLQHE